jgi:acyl-CoA thioesterase YciA
MRKKNGDPEGDLSLRVVVTQADLRPPNTSLHKWTMSLMDTAAAVMAEARSKGRVLTAAVLNVSFRHPLRIGDVVSVYTKIRKVGRTSITIEVEAYALRRYLEEQVLVTAAEFILVAVDHEGVPRILSVAA